MVESSPQTTVKDLQGLKLQSHLIVQHFLVSNGYQSTANQFRQDALKARVRLPSQHNLSLDLNTLVETYHSSISAAQQRRIKASLEATHSQQSILDPLTLRLPGPSLLPFRLASTFKYLHASNILSIAQLDLPRRHFETSTARYRNTLTKCIVTTAADKRIVFSDPLTGETEEILEGDGPECSGHKAAVLAVAQDPTNPTCLVSAGMDAKVVVWDLVSRKPVQSLSHHSKFVVRLAFSAMGDYLASAGYDRRIVIYRRTQGRQPDRRPQQNSNAQDDDDKELSPLPSVCYEKVFEMETKTNPEAIMFVRADVEPPSDEVAEAKEQIGGSIVVKEAKQKRTWLAFTVRNDSFLHYIALPLSADQVAASLEGASLEERDDGDKTRNWELKSFNTNPNSHDFHVSYSLLSLSLHPSGLFICAQTGDHTLPNMASLLSLAAGPLSRLILLPMLSSKRAGTIWTGVATSSYATPRHSWLPSGRGCWLNSEDGLLRLIDLKGKTRAQILAHGMMELEGETGEMQQATSWSRGGNTIVKDLVAIDETTVASCGFDRTVRILKLDDDILD